MAERWFGAPRRLREGEEILVEESQRRGRTTAGAGARKAEAVTQFGEECIGGSRTWVRDRHLMATWLEA